MSLQLSSPAKEQPEASALSATSESKGPRRNREGNSNSAVCTRRVYLQYLPVKAGSSASLRRVEPLLEWVHRPTVTLTNGSPCRGQVRRLVVTAETLRRAGRHATPGPYSVPWKGVSALSSMISLPLASLSKAEGEPKMATMVAAAGVDLHIAQCASSPTLCSVRIKLSGKWGLWVQYLTLPLYKRV